MEEYSFSSHVHSRLGDFLARHNFSLNKSASQMTPGYDYNLLTFESQQCQIRVFVELYRIYIEISALGVKDPNLWYNVDAMACFVSDTPPKEWIYNLPRGIPLRQVMEEQFIRWQGILERYFDQIVPLFISIDKVNEMREKLDQFVRSFYAEQQRVSLQKSNPKQDKAA